eukprot:GEMP01009910.1.p1 GENE.GEMP01009910.1~~GEMP01009910.1.p1  ORF type:complete len:361 (+),score=82.84 GEMP01009910.1:261-1343(+)
MQCNSLSASVLLLLPVLHALSSAANVDAPEVDFDMLRPDAPTPTTEEKAYLLQRAKVQIASSARGTITTRQQQQPTHHVGARHDLQSTHTNYHSNIPRYGNASHTTRYSRRTPYGSNPINLQWSNHDRVHRFSTLYEQLYTVEQACSATGTTATCARALPLFAGTLAHVRCERPWSHHQCFWQYLLVKPPAEVRAHLGYSVNVWVEWMQGRVMTSFYGRHSSEQKNRAGSRATEYDEPTAKQRLDPYNLLATILSNWNYDNFARLYTYQILTLAAAFLFFGSTIFVTYRLHLYGPSDTPVNVAFLLPGWHEPPESGLFAQRNYSPRPPPRTLATVALLTTAGCFNSYAFAFCRVPPVEAS